MLLNYGDWYIVTHIQREITKHNLFLETSMDTRTSSELYERKETTCTTSYSSMGSFEYILPDPYSKCMMKKKDWDD